MRPARLPAFILLFATVVVSPPAHSVKKTLFFCKEAYQALAAYVDANAYTHTRYLIEHIDRFGQKFERTLYSLTENDHIIDGGSGDTVAMSQYLNLSPGSEDMPLYIPRANVTAITSVMDPQHERDLRGASPKLNLLTGRYLIKIPIEEITGKFGKASLIIDHWGILAYTNELTGDLQKYVHCLKPGGKIFLAVGPRKFSYRNLLGIRKQKESMYRSLVQLKNGDKIPLPDYFKRIEGLNVTEEGENLVIEVATPASVRIPNLRFDSVDTSGPPPPARVFVEE